MVLAQASSLLEGMSQQAASALAMLHVCRYHGDDGHAFSGRGTGRAYGPTYTTGTA